MNDTSRRDAQRPDEAPDSPSLGRVLLGLARSVIEERLALPVAPPDEAPALSRRGASFVTLVREGNLRGCIGSLEARRALAADVRDNALGAAFRDPRFRPMTRGEWPGTRVEVSLLSSLEPLPVDDEGALLGLLRPQIDGLVLEFGNHRSTFLPQVWEQLPQPASFLMQLKRKAGLPPDFWEAGMRLKRYTVTKWREDDALASDEA